MSDTLKSIYVSKLKSVTESVKIRFQRVFHQADYREHNLVSNSPDKNKFVPFQEALKYDVQKLSEQNCEQNNYSSAEPVKYCVQNFCEHKNYELFLNFCEHRNSWTSRNSVSFFYAIIILFVQNKQINSFLKPPFENSSTGSVGMGRCISSGEA